MKRLLLFLIIAVLTPALAYSQSSGNFTYGSNSQPKGACSTTITPAPLPVDRCAALLPGPLVPPTQTVPLRQSVLTLRAAPMLVSAWIAQAVAHAPRTLSAQLPARLA